MTRFPQSYGLLLDARCLYGSFNKTAKHYGVPWSTVAAISSGKKPMPAALAAVIATELGRDPLAAVASVELEAAATPWQREVWRRFLTDVPGPDRGGGETTEHAITRTRPVRWPRFGFSGADWIQRAHPLIGRNLPALRARSQITGASV